MFNKEKKNKVDLFLKEKRIQTLLGKDHVFARNAATGLNQNTMFFQGSEEKPTLYYGSNDEDTTYLSVPEQTFETIDTEFDTVGDNYKAKNNIINIMTTASSILNTKGKKDIHPDVMLALVKKAEPSIDFTKFGLIPSTKNEIYDFIYNDRVSTKVSKLLSKSIEDLDKYDPTSDFEDIGQFNYFDMKLVEGIGTSKKKAKPGALPEEASTAGEAGKEGLAEDGGLEASESETEESKPTEIQLEQLKGEIQSNLRDESKLDRFFSDSPTIHEKKDFEEINSLANRLSSKLKGVYGKENTMNPTRKINVKNFVRRSPNFYKRKRDSTSGKKVKINIMVDCSGSMGGRYIKDAIRFCLIFNKIAQMEGTVKGNVILSAGEGSVVINIAEKTEKLLAKVHAFSGSEGVENSITENMGLLSKSDYNICVTDCQLTDKPINKKKYEAKNIFIDGLYIGKSSEENKREQKEHMEEFFSRGKVVDTLDDAVEHFINVCMRT